MKKIVLSSALVIASIWGFSFVKTESTFPKDTSKEVLEFFASEKVKTINSSDLNEKIRSNFSTLFDEVKSVDAQFSESIGYYYIAFGTKNGVEKIDLLKVESVDIQNEDYTYLDLSSTDLSSVTYCRRGLPNPMPPVCPEDCKAYTNGCLGVVCGILQNGNCINP